MQQKKDGFYVDISCILKAQVDRTTKCTKLGFKLLTLLNNSNYNPKAIILHYIALQTLISPMRAKLERRTSRLSDNYLWERWINISGKHLGTGQVLW